MSVYFGKKSFRVITYEDAKKHIKSTRSQKQCLMERFMREHNKQYEEAGRPCILEPVAPASHQAWQERANSRTHVTERPGKARRTDFNLTWSS